MSRAVFAQLMISSECEAYMHTYIDSKYILQSSGPTVYVRFSRRQNLPMSNLLNAPKYLMTQMFCKTKRSMEASLNNHFTNQIIIINNIFFPDVKY